MTWTLNELKKTAEKVYTPGEPGVPGDPGSPAIPGYSYSVTVDVGGSGTEISALAPLYEQYYLIPGEGEAGFRGYQYFGGRKAYASGILVDEADPETILYIYQYESNQVTTIINVPAQPAVPATPGTPSTPGQVATDYNFGWNAGAVGPYVGNFEAVRWKFSPSSVGAAVGLTQVSTYQGQTYLEMRLGVLAMSGSFSIIANGQSVTTLAPFNELTKFSIAYYEDENELSVVVNGAELYRVFSDGQVVADSSLYSGYDVILDAEIVEAGEISVNTNIGAWSESAANAEPTITRAFGPGTHNGLLGASSKSNALVDAVKVNGTIMAWAAANSTSYAEAVPAITRAFGPETWLGALGAESKSNAAGTDGGTGFSENYGSADLSFRPMIGAGAVPGVQVAWVGDYAGDSISMAPMDAWSENGDIIPITAIGAAVMVSMSGGGTGLTGETTISSSGPMRPLLALGSENEYAQGVLSMLPAFMYGSDGSRATSSAVLTFRLSLYAVALERDQTGGIMRVKNVFTAEGYGGGQMKAKARLAIEATGEGEGIGQMIGVIGYV